MGFYEGLLEGFTTEKQRQSENKNRMSEIQMQSDKERALAILKGVIEGNIEPTTNPQESIYQEPSTTIKKGLFGLGKPEVKPGQMYRKKPITLPSIEEGQMLETSYDEYGNPKGFKIAETPERKLEREVQKKELMSMAEKLPNLERAETSIASLKDLFTKGWQPESVKSGEAAKGVSERIKGLLAIPAQSWAQTNPDLRTYLEDRQAFASLLSKGGFMEAGVLTNDDIQRALKSLPNPGDSKEVVDKKWKTLDEVMTKARTNFEKKKSQYIQPKGQSQRQEQDISQMSDDELRRIASGG